MKRDTWKKRLRSFGFRITAFNLIAGLLIVSLFGAVVYAVVSDIFVRESVAKTEMAIEKVAVEIGADIRHAKSLLRLIGATPAFAGYAQSGSQAQEESVLRLMNEVTENDFYVFGVFAVFADGRIVSRNSGTALTPAEYETLLMFDMPFLTTARSADYAHDDGCVITMGIPIDTGDGGIHGVLAMDLDYCMIGDTIADTDIGGTVYITDPAGAAIFQNGPGGDAPGELAEGYDSQQNVLVHSFPIPETDWSLTGRAYLGGLDVLKRQLLDMVALTGVLLFAALLMIAVLYSRRLATPIARLAKSMEDIESLTELTALAGEISETQALTGSYNRMIRKIKQLMAALEDKQRELRRTELEALTQQINPHFLYNTLDTIVWLAEFKDNERIIALTKSLASFFRLSLGGGKAIVTLGNEIEHVKQYLFIQKARYGDKLTYRFDVDEAALDCMVPRILLQPLVENSIYHGIKPMDGVGHIAVSVRVAGDALEIAVADNGVGFDPARAKGVGLSNVEKRIQLYYGADSVLEITSAPGEGATVVLKLKTCLREDGIIG